MLKLEEWERSISKKCPCCGYENVTVHGFVYKDKQPYAVYFSSWIDWKKHKQIEMAIGVWDWSEGSSYEWRKSFWLECSVKDNDYVFSIVDPEVSPGWDNKFLGKMLSRREALKNKNIKEIFHIAEHIVKEDSRVKSRLDSINL